MTESKGEQASMAIRRGRPVIEYLFGNPISAENDAENPWIAVYSAKP